MKTALLFLVFTIASAYSQVDSSIRESEPNAKPGDLFFGLILLAAGGTVVTWLRRRSEDTAAGILCCLVVGLAIWVGSKGGFVLGFGSIIGFSFVAVLFWTASGLFNLNGHSQSPQSKQAHRFVDPSFTLEPQADAKDVVSIVPAVPSTLAPLGDATENLPTHEEATRYLRSYLSSRDQPLLADMNEQQLKKHVLYLRIASTSSPKENEKIDPS